LWRLSERGRLPEGHAAALKTLEGHTDRISDLAISTNGQVLASASEDGTVRLWGLPDGTALETLRGHEGAVNCLAIGANGRVLASGGEDKMVRLWRLPDGTTIKTLEGHTNVVRCLAVGRDQRILASGGADGEIRLWKMGPLLLTGLPVGQISIQHMKWVQETLQKGKITDAERSWLEFLLALMRWGQRLDIEVAEAPTHVPAGDFDIEIE
jgi:WD40 repeat protein